MFSFFPLGLAYQFLRFSNCYFLIVTILSCIPSISPVNPITAINPFVFVLVVSMIREGYEDYQRYKSDLGKFKISSLIPLIFSPKQRRSRGAGHEDQEVLKHLMQKSLRWRSCSLPTRLNFSSRPCSVDE